MQKRVKDGLFLIFKNMFSCPYTTLNSTGDFKCQWLYLKKDKTSLNKWFCTKNWRYVEPSYLLNSENLNIFYTRSWLTKITGTNRTAKTYGEPGSQDKLVPGKTFGLGWKHPKRVDDWDYLWNKNKLTFNDSPDYFKLLRIISFMVVVTFHVATLWQPCQ